MLFNKELQNGMKCSLSIIARPGMTIVDGTIHPLNMPYTSVKFKATHVRKTPTDEAVNYSIGHSCSYHDGNEADLITAATNDALAQAKKYEGILNELRNPQKAVEDLTESLEQQDLAEAHEIMMLAPCVMSKFNDNDSVIDGLIRSPAFDGVMSKLVEVSQLSTEEYKLLIDCPELDYARCLAEKTSNLALLDMTGLNAVNRLVELCERVRSGETFNAAMMYEKA